MGLACRLAICGKTWSAVSAGWTSSSAAMACGAEPNPARQERTVAPCCWPGQGLAHEDIPDRGCWGTQQWGGVGGLPQPRVRAALSGGCADLDSTQLWLLSLGFGLCSPTPWRGPPQITQCHWPASVSPDSSSPARCWKAEPERGPLGSRVHPVMLPASPLHPRSAPTTAQFFSWGVLLGSHADRAPPSSMAARPPP